MNTHVDPTPARTILLVDDDAITTLVMSQVLREAGYDTIEVRSGQEAIALLTQVQVDLALLDVMMGDMSGIELAQYLKDKTDIPFLLISANAETDIVKQAIQHGAFGYLVKPFEIAQIVPTCEAAIGRADEIKQLRTNEISLTNALNASRETSMAIGLLMSKFNTDRTTAFDVLRKYARSNRCKIDEVANNLLAAEELFNSIDNLFPKNSSKQNK